MSSRTIFESDNVSSARAIDAHGSSNLVSTGDACQLVTRPDTKYGSNCEVRVDNAGPIKRVECYTETTIDWSTHVLQLRDFLGARILADMRVFQSLEEELVGEHIDGELLVTEGVDAGGAPHDAVLTLNEIVLIASPMQMSSLMRFLSGVALVRNSSRLSPISHRVLSAARLAALDCLPDGSDLAVLTRSDSP